MHHPPHPGEVIRELCIEPLGLTVNEATMELGVYSKTLSAGISIMIDFILYFHGFAQSSAQKNLPIH